jgi:hypothetical protein
MNLFEKRMAIALFIVGIILVGIIVVYAINARPPTTSPYRQVWPKLNENHTAVLSEIQSSYNITDYAVFALEVDIIMTNNTPVTMDFYVNGSEMLHFVDVSGKFPTAIRLGPDPYDIEPEEDYPSHNNFTICFSRQDSDVNVSFRIRTWFIATIFTELDPTLELEFRFAVREDVII